MQIEFKNIDIKGFEGLYAVSRCGKVKSNRWNKILKPGITTNGYLMVCLNNKCSKKTATIHRLVADAFLPKSEGKNQVNHKNCDKQDNRVENLEWCNQSENVQHMWDMGIRKTRILIESEREAIKVLTEEGVGYKDIAAFFGIGKWRVYQLKKARQRQLSTT